jgi:hypothetical protein
MESLKSIHRIMEDGSKTQRQRFSDVLKMMNTDITATDRKACLEAFDISEPTLKRYLLGYVGDNDKAANLINFFKKRIEKRDRIIAA